VGRNIYFEGDNMALVKTVSVSLLVGILMCGCDRDSSDTAQKAKPDVVSTTPQASAAVVAESAASSVANRPPFNVALRCAAIASFDREVMKQRFDAPNQMRETERKKFDQLTAVANNARFLAFAMGDEKGLSTSQVERQIDEAEPKEGRHDYYERACLTAFAKK
jgi:hypothetical protein